jgi:PAS domain S-box-containing protein
MKRIWTGRFSHSAAQCALGISVVALLTFAAFRLQASTATAVLLYLLIIVPMSLWASFAPSAVVSTVAVLCLQYFFVPPDLSLGGDTLDFVALVAFLTTALVITRLMSTVRTALQEVVRSQQQWKDVFENNPTMYFIVDASGTVLSVNPFGAEQLGYTVNELVGQSVLNVFHEADREAAQRHVANCLELRGQTMSWEVRKVRKDGTMLWVRETAKAAQRGESQSIVLIACEDITDRKQAENAVREQASLLELTHDSIFVRGMDDVITYWNRGAEELYGWKREEALGKVTRELLQTILPVPLEEITAPLLQTGRWSGELIHTKRDGTEAVVASRWSVQRDEQGRPVAMLETNNDITERKRAEEALIRQANLLELTHDAIFVWEFRGPISYWNRGAEQLYGFSKQEAIGRLGHELLHTSHPMPVPVFESVLERNGEWTGELTQTTRDGRRIIVESRHVLLRQADGRRLVLETNRDITERRQAEDAVRKAQAELAHVARVTTMGEMAASIAHEVNQPLSGVVVNANACVRWLAGSPPNLDEARDALQRIVRDGKRASDVIARIRALSKKTGGEREPIDLNEAIQEVVALALGEVRRTRVALRTELAGTLPRVLGDRVQLQQVVLNLVLNAVEAMSDVVDRPKDLVIRTEKDEAGRARVVVRDSGAGLDPQNADRIFDAFYTTKRGGLGMGLSISRSIVENHGGRLWAIPNNGPGTTFQFTL